MYIAQISIVVRDYDEAIDFYVNKLGWQLLEDTVLSEEKDGSAWHQREPENVIFFSPKQKSTGINQCRKPDRRQGWFFYAHGQLLGIL